MSKEEKNSNKCPICGRPTHKESKYCIFHASAEEKTEEKFKEALREYIQEIKEGDRDYDFERFIFIGDIDFKEDLNVTIFKNADFGKATFEGYADFSGSTFQKRVGFIRATFKEMASFIGSTFKEEAFFRNVTFKREASFMVATFEGYADFAKATFKKDAFFNKANFEVEAYFGYATFKRRALFNEATFKGEEAYFGRATFEEDANFRIKSFVKGVIFEEISVLPGKKLNLKVENNKGTISFKRTFLKNVYLDIDLDKDVLIDFTDALLMNTKIKKGQIENHILWEKKKEFSKAKEVYLLLKNNFHHIGQYEDESWAFKKEKDMERKSNFHFKTLHKWLWSCFLNAIYGYGEKPERVIISAILIILIYAFVFMNYGIVSDPQLDNLPKHNILKELFMGIRYGDLLIRFKDISWEQIKNCLYFSTVTFTTLGLGDFSPVESWGRIFVGSEAFIGAFMMALFVYTFARRTGGR